MKCCWLGDFGREGLEGAEPPLAHQPWLCEPQTDRSAQKGAERNQPSLPADESTPVADPCVDGMVERMIQLLWPILTPPNL